MDSRSTLLSDTKLLLKRARHLDRRRVLVLILSLALCVPLLGGTLLLSPTFAFAHPSVALKSTASCTQLARQDPTATNGSTWGRTILAGYNAPRGWFGVDVCSNGLNSVAPNAANVSCDAVPDNWPAKGCAPGRATRDGFGLTFQCVELIARFAVWAFGDQPSAWRGDAPDLWLPGNHPAGWIMYPNGSQYAPVPGDVLVFGAVNARGAPWPAGPDGDHGGHVAIVAAVRGGEIITAEQNVKWGSVDHPSDLLGLTHAGGRWIVSGTSAHSTTLPAFRWQSSMGHTRALYGWLHATKNSGTFPTRGGTSQATSTAPAVTPKQASGTLPSLAPATVITSAGTLADLVWTSGGVLPDDAADAQAHVSVRSLGAPATSPITLGQTPASVVLPDGQRDTYVVGTDGHLYVARTDPQVFGISWLDYGTPDGVSLQPGVSATTYAGGMGVAVLDVQGNLWWRAGPVGQPGSWLPLDHPAGTSLAGSFALRGAPGTGAPLVLALGADGVLYERVWQPAVSGADGATQVPAGWSQWLALHLAPSGVQLSGALVAVPETAHPQFWIGGWPDTPLDVFVLDTQHQLWLLRLTALARGWTASHVTLSHTPAMLIAGAAVAPALSPQDAATSATPAAATTAASVLLHLYLTTSSGVLRVAVSLTTTAAVATLQPDEAMLPPVTTASGLPAVALPVGPAASVLIAPQVEDVLVGGTSESAAALLPASGSGTMSNRAVWVSAGRVALGVNFDDAFARQSLDARWTLVGPHAQTRGSSGGLALTAPAGAAALLQSVPPGDTLMLGVTVTLPPHPTATLSAGLLLYLDDGDWLTLALQRGQVALCGVAWGETTPCVTQALKAPMRTIALRLSRDTDGYTAAFSLDGTTWHTVGVWLPPQPPGAGTTPTASATANAATPTPSATSGATQGTPPLVAPVAFTECGLVVNGSTSAAAAPLFTNFTQSAAAAGGM
jgi:hypothetical protein